MHLHLMQVQLALPLPAMVDDEQLAVWRAFLNAHARVTRAIGRDLAEAGLPDLTWYDLLWTLYKQPGRSLRVKELAEEVVLSPTAMSRFVDRVEVAGCVRREPDPDDRRALQVRLTGEGVALLRKMWPVYADGIERYFAAHLEDGSLRETLERLNRA
jgi:DNA-binding MarR family transcriptional regulator